jgi:hypothetical protein
MNGVQRARPLAQLPLHGIADHLEEERFERHVRLTAVVLMVLASKVRSVAFAAVASDVVSAAKGWTSVFAPIHMKPDLFDLKPKLRMGLLLAAEQIDRLGGTRQVPSGSFATRLYRDRRSRRRWFTSITAAGKTHRSSMAIGMSPSFRRWAVGL